MQEREAVIVEALRTPVGRLKGVFSNTEAYTLGAVVIKELLEKAPIDCKEIDDVILGNLLTVPGNVARVSALEAGLPEEIPALTVDRQCASGLDAINIAASMILSNAGDTYIVGGVENMTRQPFYLEKQNKAFPMKQPKFLNAMMSPPSIGDPSMIQTARNLEVKFRVSKEDQDNFAYRSQMRAKDAIENRRFKEQIVPVNVPGKMNENFIVEKDEAPRPDTTPEGLFKLRSIVGEDSGITAGNSCPMNDGAAALLIMDKHKALEKGYTDMLRVRQFSYAGLDPSVMGLGPIFAVRKLLQRAPYSISDFDIIELNEAFAVQSLICITELGMNTETVNPNGGAIALGHPLGATGAILVVKLFHEMKRRELELGVVTMCVGGGQGVATIFERITF